MEHIKVYIFNSESEATELIERLDEIKGLPTECGSTLTYCNFEVVNDKIAIRWDEFIESVLGEEPQEIEMLESENPFEDSEFSLNS